MNAAIFIRNSYTLARGWAFAANTAATQDDRDWCWAKADRFEHLAQLARTDLPAAAAEFANTSR